MDPAPPNGTAPAPSDLQRAVRAIGIALIAIDFGSLSFLLWRLEIAWWLAVPLGVGVGVFTGYELQWRYLVSPKAFRAARSKRRFIAAAVVIVLVNLGASSLLLLRLWYLYLFVRILAALIGAWTWTRWQVGRVMGAVRAGGGAPPR